MRNIEPLEKVTYSPFSSVLVKAEEEEGKRILYLQASNEGVDQDNEVLLCKALKESADYFMTHGVISYDHRHRIDPEYQIGEPIDVRFDDQNRTLVKCFLYSGNRVATALWNNIRSGAKRLGASVGGGILKKASDGLKNVIEKVVWSEVAVTPSPVNDGTLGLVTTVPFPEFAKSLMAGTGVNAGSFTGGRALVPESLQGARSVQHLDPEELNTLYLSLLKSIHERKVTSYGDMLEFVLNKGYAPQLSAEIITYLTHKIGSIGTQK